MTVCVVMVGLAKGFPLPELCLLVPLGAKSGPLIVMLPGVELVAVVSLGEEVHRRLQQYTGTRRSERGGDEH